MRRYAVTMSLLATTMLLPCAENAQAKQCVFNKGGYVLKVKWYRPADLTVIPPQGYVEVGVLSAHKPPVQEDSLTAGFGACTKGDDVLTAVVGVVGCWGYVFPGPQNVMRSCSGKIWYHRNTLTSGPAWCNPKSDYCDAVPGNGNENPGWSDVPTVLYVTPRTDQYLDFWGTIDTVRFGPGGPIEKSAAAAGVRQ